MAKLDFIFSVHMCAISQSISIMRMLAEQAEKNVALAVKEANEPGAVKEHEFEEESCDQDGESYVRIRTCYSCGSSVDYDPEEALAMHQFLITQLTRRSAYLTMFGLFEHRISQCLEFMIDLTRYDGEVKGMGPLERAQYMLLNVVGGNGIKDLDHLTVLRNIMIHSDGVAKGYEEMSTRKSRKTPAEKRVLSAIRRATGVSLNMFDGVIMGQTFLTYAVDEFERYVREMEAAVQNYHKNMAIPHV
ncbi:hypothetical protein CCOS865_04143 [Pseudomonas reidholzensis]|uniref:Uncharacterized protein n=1 Tax=Pseudomonas reidholzensis TaxID=1785162 RepID=A0A383RYM3_9PSED|nr:hypothetical protein [Pseudomonas reidholzensis]SYX91863.1 hypothetical protein CCOS865_04143 [Pseudomonas reidholzensis]